MSKALVLASIEAPDGVHCVDLFRDDAGFGYILCRRDPEDGHGWRHLPAEGQSGFVSAQEARAAATLRFAWVADG